MSHFCELTFSQDPERDAKHQSWLDNPPQSVKLGTTVEELLAPSKRNKKSNNNPPRPQQSFILFRKNFKSLHTTLKFDDLSRAAKEAWKNAVPEVKEYFEMLAGEAKKRHSTKYPDYKYKPRRTRDVFRPGKCARKRGAKSPTEATVIPVTHAEPTLVIEPNPQIVDENGETTNELYTSAMDSNLFANFDSLLFDEMKETPSPLPHLIIESSTDSSPASITSEYNSLDDDTILYDFFDFFGYSSEANIR